MNNENKKPRLDLMIDLETLGTNVNKAPILSIAIYSFNPFEGEVEAKELFNMNIDLNSSLSDVKREIEIGTLKWWMTQPAEAFDNATKDAEPAWRVLANLREGFEDWAEEHELYLWCKGIDFDIPMLESYLCYNRSTYKIPYFFSHKYDVRTILKVAEFGGWVDQWKDKIAHTAGGDCVTQIEQTRSALAYLKR